MPIGPIQTLQTTIAVAGGEAAIDTLYSVSNAFQSTAQAALDTVAMTESLRLSTDALIASELVSTGQARNIAQARQMSAAAAEELFQWNKELAILSPLGAMDVANATALAQAYGFLATQTMSVEQAQKAGIVTAQRLSQAMVDFTAGTGKEGHVITNLVTQMGQIQASGRATGEELKTLSEWGLRVNDYLADAFGVTTGEIQRMQQAGELVGNEVIPAIVEGMEREFGGAAAKAAGTLRGLTASLSDLKNFALADLFGDSIALGQEQLDALVQTLRDDDVQASIQEWGATIAGGVAAVGTLAGTMNSLLVPALGGATVAWGSYATAQALAAAQHRAWVAGGLGRAVSASLLGISRNIGANVAATNAWVAANRTLMRTAMGGAAVGAAIYVYQEYNKTLDEHTENLFANSERWATLQKARQAYAAASPEVQAALKSDMEALEASAEATEQQTRADAEVAARGLIHRAENHRIAVQNANIRTAAVEDEAEALLGKIDVEEQAELAALETAHADQLAAQAAQERKAALQEYLRDERDLRVALTTEIRAIETDHQADLAALDAEVAEQRADAAQERDEKLITIERNRRDALAQEAEAYIVRLHDLAESAADAGISALSDVTAADVAFIRDSRTRLAEYNDTRETLHRQGALACSREELDALIEQEAQAARSYAEQESELEAHLGRRLIAYTQAQALIYGVSQDATNAMVQGIAREFGVLETASQRSFGQMRESIDVWAQSGGKNTQQVIAGFGALRREAVETELAYEKLMDTRSEELARAFAEGRISEADYLSQLQTLGRDVSLSLGLGIDESAYSTDVTSAAEEHRARLVEIDRNANQERITAYQEWAEKDEELRTTYREEQALALEEDRQVEMQKIRDAYAEELADLIAHNKDLEEEEIRHLREGREIKARQMAEIDSIAEREIEELRAKNLPLAEEVAEYERIIADAERRRRVIESIPEDLAQHEGEDWGADFGSSSSEPTPQSSQRLPQNPKEPPKLPPRKDPPALPSSPRSAYGARLQPVSIVVNNNNPVVDTPERERRLAQQTREQVRATLDEWTSDALLRGRLG